MANTEIQEKIAAPFREKGLESDTFKEIGNRKDRVGVVTGPSGFKAQTADQLQAYEQATGRKWSEDVDRPVAKDPDLLGVNPGGEPQSNNQEPVDFAKVEKKAMSTINTVSKNVDDTVAVPDSSPAANGATDRATNVNDTTTAARRVQTNK